MQVVVDDKIKEIKIALNNNGVNIIEKAIEDKDKPDRDPNGLLVLTPEQFDYWTKEAESYRKRKEKEAQEKNKNNPQEEPKEVIIQDDSMTKESFIAPVTFPSKESIKKIKSFTPEVEEYHKRLENLTEEEKNQQEEEIQSFVNRNKENTNNPKNKKGNKNKKTEDGFASQEGQTEETTKDSGYFYGWKDNQKKDKNKDEIEDEIGNPFIIPTPPSLEDLEKKKKDTVSNLDSSDSFISYAAQRKKEQESRERTLEEIEMPKQKTQKEIEEDVLEAFANHYNFSLRSDVFLEHKKKLPAILLPEKLKTLFMNEAAEEELTPSQFFGKILIKYMFRKKTEGEE